MKKNGPKIEDLIADYQAAIEGKLSQIQRKHTYAQAMAILKSFEDTLEVLGVKPVYVGLGTTPDDFVIKCSVASNTAQERLPKIFDGLTVASHIDGPAMFHRLP